jgi:hypothetical protein
VRLDHLLSRELFYQLVAFGYWLLDRVFSQVDPTQVVYPALAGFTLGLPLLLVTFSTPQTFSAPLSSRPGAGTSAGRVDSKASAAGQ